MKRLRGKLTYANVISTIALFLVLAGGSALAAKEALLPKNSVGSKQLKPGAVIPAKLSAGAVAALTGKEGPAGPKGEPGEPGPAGLRGPAGTDASREPLAIDANGEVADVRTGGSIPLTGTTTWSSTPGQVGLLLGKMTSTLAVESGGYICSTTVTVFDNGAQVASFFSNGSYSGSFVEGSTNLTPVAIDIDEPGPHTITATSNASTECKPGSKVDSLTLLVAPQGK